MTKRKSLALLLALSLLLTPAFTQEAHAAGACGIGACSCTSCHEVYSNYQYYSEALHTMKVKCSDCDAWAMFGGSESHTFSGNTCIYCGYSKACSHSSTSKTWTTSCDWVVTCDACGTTTDSGTTHGPYTYGSWSYYNATKHRRSYTCSYGDSGTYYETANHSKSTSYALYSDTQHAVSTYCSTCASTVGAVSYADHTFTYRDWENYSFSQHRRIKLCTTCGYADYEYNSHSYTYGAWTQWTDLDHMRTGTCTCGATATESNSHLDSNDDGCCDACGHLMTRFSVTLPAVLPVTVSRLGEVYTAADAVIANNSTGAVKVTALTLTAGNGWTLVPYDTDMARAKVDAKQIGFLINGAQTTAGGSSETLGLSGGWTIAKDSSLTLAYNAIVSAMSQPVNEQVLTLVFVLDWA